MTQPSLINGIAHLGIRVHDLARARAFYEMLGFEFILGPVGPEPVAMLKHPANIEINLILNAAPSVTHNVLMDVDEKNPGYTHVALSVSDIDGVKALLDAEGIEITGGPLTYPGGARSLFVRDPSRNVVELYQPAE